MGTEVESEARGVKGDDQFWRGSARLHEQGSRWTYNVTVDFIGNYWDFPFLGNSKDICDMLAREVSTAWVTRVGL